MSSESSGEFHRIRRLPPYVFAEVNSAKAKARTAGEDIIDLGMGNPDSPTPRHIVEKLIETVQDPRTHRYSVSAASRVCAGHWPLTTAGASMWGWTRKPRSLPRLDPRKGWRT